MQPDIEITGLSRVHVPERNKRGDTILAYFDCALGPIVMRGCALAQRRDGFLTVWEPRLTDLVTPRAVYIADRDVKGDVAQAARAAFEALGGTVLEAGRFS